MFFTVRGVYRFMYFAVFCQHRINNAVITTTYVWLYCERQNTNVRGRAYQRHMPTAFFDWSSCDLRRLSTDNCSAPSSFADPTVWAYDRHPMSPCNCPMSISTDVQGDVKVNVHCVQKKTPQFITRYRRKSRLITDVNSARLDQF